MNAGLRWAEVWTNRHGASLLRWLTVLIVPDAGFASLRAVSEPSLRDSRWTDAARRAPTAPSWLRGVGLRLEERPFAGDALEVV